MINEDIRRDRIDMKVTSNWLRIKFQVIKENWQLQDKLAEEETTSD